MTICYILWETQKIYLCPKDHLELRRFKLTFATKRELWYNACPDGKPEFYLCTGVSKFVSSFENDREITSANVRLNKTPSVLYKWTQYIKRFKKYQKYSCKCFWVVRVWDPVLYLRTFLQAVQMVNKKSDLKIENRGKTQFQRKRDWVWTPQRRERSLLAALGCCILGRRKQGPIKIVKCQAGKLT